MKPSRVVVIDENGKQQGESLPAALSPQPRAAVASCYLRLPRLLGESPEMAEAVKRAERQPSPDDPVLVRPEVRSAVIRVSPGDAQPTLVRGVAPDLEGSPSRWGCTTETPLGLSDQPIGCQGLLSFAERAHRLFETLMLVLVGTAISVVVQLAVRAVRPSPPAQKAK